ncbi:MAG: hypothetical protein WAX04_07580 [Oscillospiraceae bacterium]
MSIFISACAVVFSLVVIICVIAGIYTTTIVFPLDSVTTGGTTGVDAGGL